MNVVPAAELDLQLERREPVAVPAVDPRLAGVQRREVAALAAGLLEVVPHHRGQEAAAAVVGVDADPGQPRHRDRAPGAGAVGDGQLHRAYAVDARVGARVDVGADDLGREPLVRGDVHAAGARSAPRPGCRTTPACRRRGSGRRRWRGPRGCREVSHVVQQTRAARRVSTRLSARPPGAVRSDGSVRELREQPPRPVGHLARRHAVHLTEELRREGVDVGVGVLRAVGTASGPAAWRRRSGRPASSPPPGRSGS